jgi:hypothetical protein
MKSKNLKSKAPHAKAAKRIRKSPRELFRLPEALNPAKRDRLPRSWVLALARAAATHD